MVKKVKAGPFLVNADIMVDTPVWLRSYIFKRMLLLIIKINGNSLLLTMDLWDFEENPPYKEHSLCLTKPDEISGKEASEIDLIVILRQVWC